MVFQKEPNLSKYQLLYHWFMIKPIQPIKEIKTKETKWLSKGLNAYQLFEKEIRDILFPCLLS